jgi:hypothetical protein
MAVSTGAARKEGKVDGQPKLEEQIIALYDSNLVNLYSINGIAKALKKTYPFINKKVTELLDRGILRKTVIGKSYLCSLNFDNKRTVHMLAALEIRKRPQDTGIERIERFIASRTLTMTIHCVVKHGERYLFVVENLRDRREIQRELSDAEVCDKKEFLDILIDDQKIYSEHTVVYGAERFYELLTLDLPELKKVHSPFRY